MPLTPATTDKFMKVGNPGTATTLSAPGYTIGNTSVTVGSTTNWPTDTQTAFAMDTVTIVAGVATRVAGSYCEFTGIVTGANTIASMALAFGTAQNYAAGSLARVYIPVTGTRENALVDGLNVDHNGKGNHKSLTDDNGNTWLGRTFIALAVNFVNITNSITGKNPRITAAGADTNLDLQLDGKGTGVAVARNPEVTSNFVASGGVWTGDSYGSTLNASMTAMVIYINGRRIQIAAVTARAFTTNLDTYIDVLDNLDGTGTLVYTTASPNAASPALAANSLRVGIIQAGANIASVAAINQGQEFKVLPIASSIPYQTTDSLGNLICPRTPNSVLLGLRRRLSTFSTTSASFVDITELTVPFVLGGADTRKAKFIIDLSAINANGAGTIWNLALTLDGTVIHQWYRNQDVASLNMPFNGHFTKTISAGSHTAKLQLLTSGGTTTISAGADNPGTSQFTPGPASLKVEIE